MSCPPPYAVPLLPRSTQTFCTLGDDASLNGASLLSACLYLFCNALCQVLVVEDNGRGMSKDVLLNYLRLCDTTSRIPDFPRGELANTTID